MGVGEKIKDAYLKESSEEDEEDFKETVIKDIKKHFKSLFDVNAEDFEFTLETALYWFAHDYHKGQKDEWYRILSSSKFKPGRSHSSIEDEENYEAQEIYSYLEKKYVKNGKLQEAKGTTLKVTFDDGSTHNIEFAGTFEAGKEAYLGKKVKHTRKTKSGDVVNVLKAVKVEELGAEE
jgi:hypothetical protein